MKTAHRPVTREDGIFPIRSVQLDLARQIETVDFIKEFSEFAAENGFNSLTLYLEGRIRTASFPYPTIEESYTSEQIRDIVQHANQCGLDVIPVVSTLGHAELFLQHAELAHLAETRHPYPGRFGAVGTCDVFCPSLPETYEFLRRYLAEVAELFPSAYFHAGCDETWDMACCDLCRERLARGETQADIFSRHLEKTHDIICGELKKRMIMWDDMFEYYPEALDRLPRNVVLAHWQYQDQVGPSRAHFFHSLAEDTLAKYVRMGFDFLIGPSDYVIENAESFTAYAAPYQPLGALLTTWEKMEPFPLQNRPLIARVGRMWAAGDCRTTLEPIGDLFGTTDSILLKAMQSLSFSTSHHERRTRTEEFLTKGENSRDHSRKGLINLLLEILPGYRDKVRPSAIPILDDILISLSSERVSYQLDDLLPAFFGEHQNATMDAALDGVCSEIEILREARLALWHTVRPNISTKRIEALYAGYLENLRSFPEFARNHGTLRLHFFLPDQYASQSVRISIQYAGDETPVKIAEGVFKEVRDFDAFYSRIFPVSLDREPTELLIETFGFGGQGFTWAEVQNSCGRFVPEAVIPTHGILSHPDALLAPDWKWAYSGERDAKVSYLHLEKANEVHSFRIALTKSLS